MYGLLVVAVMLFASGCADARGPSGSTTRDETDALVATLRARGLAIEDAGMVSQPFFGVPARVFRGAGGELQVFEFGTAERAAEQARLVAPTGGSIGTVSVAWVAPAHFFRSGRLVVLYLGTNGTGLQALSEILGRQFAGA